ncbi:hypothetical protein F5146DRAFT_1130547 [Armillaria mellea]|nr:hypothetical protein F5146DRAFT_1130547 [Armillaria mellea]
MSPNDPEMRVFSKITPEVTSASSLLNSLKENLPFLKDGFGNVIVTKIEYCKCKKAWEHEFLLVTLKESVGARRTALLLVDWRIDDTKEYTGGQDELLADIIKHQGEETADTATDSNSSAESESGALPAAQQCDAPSGVQRSGAKLKSISKRGPPNALDELVILPNRNAVAGQLGNHSFNVLMTMDLTHSHNKITLERFAHLLRTASRNTPQYHFIFAQCYWYAYTIWRVLELETSPRIHKFDRSGRHCSYSGGIGRLVLGKGKFVSIARAPETVKAQWEAERSAEDQEWAERREALHEEVRHEAQARREAEEGRREAEERVRELQRRLESFELAARSATV